MNSLYFKAASNPMHRDSNNFTSVIFIRSQAPSSDSRLQRYFLALNRLNIPFNIIGWKRNVEDSISETDTIFQWNAPTGKGLTNLFGFFAWNIFIFFKLIKMRNVYKVIHAVDLDSIVPAFVAAKLFRKRLIFDVYDKYSESRKIPTFSINWVNKSERWLACKVDALILPDICRVEQLGLPDHKNVHIIENVPITTHPIIPSNTVSNKDQEIQLVYVGILEAKHRGLENLIAIVKKNIKVRLNIAGHGRLKEFVEEAAKECNRIKYFGTVNSEDAFRLLSNADIHIGMYYTTCPNHCYAAPNKYYEHLMHGKPLLSTIGTPPGHKIERLRTGYAIQETDMAIQLWIEGLSRLNLLTISQNASKLWVEKYANYFENHFKSEYSKALGLIV